MLGILFLFINSKKTLQSKAVLELNYLIFRKIPKAIFYY